MTEAEKIVERKISDMTYAEIQAEIEREVAEEMAKPTIGGDLTPLAESILEVARKHDFDKTLKRMPDLALTPAYAFVIAARRYLGKR